MKKIFKKMVPYIIINAIVYAIIGAIIGKNYVEIKNTRTKIQNDEKALKKFMKDMVNACPNKMKLDDLVEDDPKDPKDPMDPTVIYVYD